MSSRDVSAYYGKRPDWISWTVVCAHAAFVVAPIYLGLFFAPGWVTLACWLGFGFTLHGLTNMMHEASHRLLFKQRRANDILGTYLLGPLLMADFGSYRLRHFAHHRHLGDPDDTKSAYLVNIRGFGFIRLLFESLFFIAAARLGRKQLASTKEKGRWAPILLFQLFFFASLFLVALLFMGFDVVPALARSVFVYIVVYLYGLVSLTVMISTLRAIAEHQVADVGGMISGRAALRNLKSNPLSRLVFGAYGFAEHASHHEWPAIPSYRLGAATELIGKEKPELQPRLGYFQIISALSRSSPETPG